MKIFILLIFSIFFNFSSCLYEIRSDWRSIPPAHEAPEFQATVRNFFGSSKVPTRRIVNGDSASLGQFPHQVLKFMQAPNGESYYCGGSIIGAHWVLTAAHCLANRINVEIYAGFVNANYAVEYYSGIIYSTAFRIHESYNPSFLDHDIALIQVITPIQRTQNVNLIPLPRRRDASTSVVGFMATASGFGATYAGGARSQNLRFWYQPIAPDSVCLSYYAPGWFTPGANLCMDTSSGKAICQGDSGGAILIDVNGRRGVFGIVSFGASVGCDRRLPEVYVKVTAYLDWLHWYTSLVEQ